jgi:hypothetical protein
MVLEMHLLLKILQYEDHSLSRHHLDTIPDKSGPNLDTVPDEPGPDLDTVPNDSHPADLSENKV